VIDRAAHVWTDDDRVFAVAMSGDVVQFAIEVYEPRANDLADDVERAIVAGDVGLADYLSELLAYGRALVIGAYFEVLV
jgi:hypothetical protein